MEAQHLPQGVSLGSTPQTPMDKMTLSPKNDRGQDLSAQQASVMKRDMTTTIDHKPMRLKNKTNAIGSLGDQNAFS